ncbi:SNF2-related protein, partial [Klebsiella pneumoniae]|uniref:SNF2-related protein n=1 Tax=Klebsiella pneumoniae TaxID=573 RepID=UPI00273094FC
MLRKHHLGGLLADDMGLGKTLQTLAILSDYYEQQNQDRKLSLVVCPKTLLFNWAIEIEKFHPNLTYIIYEGSKRERTKL